jgi:hypothetical protein
MTLLKLRASVSDTADPLLGSFHLVRSAFSTTLWQYAFTRNFRFFQIVLPPVNTTSMLPTKALDQHTTYRDTAIPFLARVDCKIKISNANFTSEIRKTIVLGIFLMK